MGAFKGEGFNLHGIFTGLLALYIALLTWVATDLVSELRAVSVGVRENRIELARREGLKVLAQIAPANATSIAVLQAQYEELDKRGREQTALIKDILKEVRRR